MAKLKQDLKDNFTMMDLSEMKKILGIQVIRDRQAGTLKILQSAYINKILVHFNMAKVNPVLTPLSKKSNLKTLKYKPKIQQCHTPRRSDPSCMWQYRHGQIYHLWYSI